MRKHGELDTLPASAIPIVSSRRKQNCYQGLQALKLVHPLGAKEERRHN
jgi:hypothetical protein